MSISSENRKAGPYTGNGVTVTYPFSFKVFTAADVYVVTADTARTETVLTMTTDYTVSLNADQNASPGGSITLTTALASGYLLVITSSATMTQPMTLLNGGGFYPQTLNDMADRLTILAQQIREVTSRALVQPITGSQDMKLMFTQLSAIRDNYYGYANTFATLVANAQSSANSASGSATAASSSATAASDSAAAAAGSSNAAQSSATAAQTSQTNAATSEANALSYSVQAANSAAAALGKNIFPTTAAGVGNGVAGITGLVGGSGGTNGTFALSFSGGTQVVAPVGYFVVSGGAVTQVTISYPGYYSAGTPTLSFSASSGLTGASATAVMAANTPSGVYFSVQSANSNNYLDLYKNVSGTATYVTSYPSATYVTTRATGKTPINLVNIAAAGVALGNTPNPSSPGDLLANASYNTTDYIPVTGSTTYTLSPAKHIVTWYDANKIYISGSGSGVTTQQQAAPSNAAFMRASFSLANWARAQIEVGSTASNYEPYYDGVWADPAAIKRLSLDATHIFKRGTLPVHATGFIAVGTNKFNKNTCTDGYILDNLGAQSANASFSISDYIAVTPSTNYYGTGGGKSVRFTTYYDEYFNLISGGVSSSSENTFAFTTPANVYWMRISVRTTVKSAFQLELGTSGTTYKNYGYKIIGPNGEILEDFANASSNLDASQFPDRNIPTLKIALQAITRKETNFLKLGKNLFNQATITANSFITHNTGAITTNSSYFVSDFIEISPSTAYYGSGLTNGFRSICFYDSTGTLIGVSGINDPSNATTGFTSPATAYFVRFSALNTNLATFQLEAGTVQTGYESYGYKILGPNGETLIGGGGGSSSTFWSGKKLGTMCDSNGNTGWQALVATALSLTFPTNNSIAGTRISGPADGSTNAMSSDTRINAIPSDCDIILVHGGTNDWQQNVALGSANSTDVSTFYGALNVMIQKLLTRFPSKRVAIASCIYGERRDYVGASPYWPNAYTNLIGLTMFDYAAAIRQACLNNGVPCVDTIQECGWSAANVTTYITNETNAYLHMNTAGINRYGSVIVNNLKKLQPLS